MKWLKGIFSSGATELVDTIGNVVDKLFTSDEERLTIKARINAAVMSYKEKQMGYVAEYDKEISKRHEIDMKSDSWLSKNVRPMTLIFLTVATIVLAYLTIFLLPENKVVLVQPWIDLLTVLLVTVYAFYFGSRGVEKITKKLSG